MTLAAKGTLWPLTTWKPSGGLVMRMVGVGAASLSLMTILAMTGEPRTAPPVGALSVTVKFTVPPKRLGSRMGMVKALSAVSPSIQETVLEAAV